MARHRKIDVRIWGDEKFRRLSAPRPSGQSLLLYLLTSPFSGSLPGLFRAGAAGMAEELGWSAEAFREAFQEVSREGIAKADWDARVVWIPKAIAYNVPESPNVVRSWRAQWDELPECDLKREAFCALASFVEGLGEGYAKAFGEVIAKPSPKAMPNQEQEQEQEVLPPSVGDAKAPPAPSKPKPKRDDVTQEEQVGRGEVLGAYRKGFMAARGIEPARGDAGKNAALALRLVRKLGVADAVATIDAAFADQWHRTKVTLQDIVGNPDKYRGLGQLPFSATSVSPQHDHEAAERERLGPAPKAQPREEAPATPWDELEGVARRLWGTREAYETACLPKEVA
jgi:hypothetical protein